MSFFTGTVLASSTVVGSSGDTYGTHYSVLGIGGYLEVETIAQRNAIPVDTTKGLDWDGLSSGRRRYNMQVNVAEDDVTYQLHIPYTAWTGMNESQKVAALADNNNWRIDIQGKLDAGEGIDSTLLSGGTIALNLSNFNSPTSIAISIPTGSTSFVVTDNSDTPQGIVMAADYSLTANPLSLMPKSYIDSLAAGFDPKESVNVATTTGDGDIDLTGGTFSSGSTIDGVVVNDGWRVLIKNQSNAVYNGIYVYSASTSGFTRSEDFDGTPAAEVSTGAFTNVITGATLYNTQWMVVGTDPIVVDTDPINWTLSHQAISHIAGVGINITGNTISFDGANVAGDSMTWSGTQLDVDPTSGSLLTALNTKTDLSLFNTYTGDTDTILTGLRTDVDTVSGQTDTNTTDIANLKTDTITGATNIGGASEIFTTVTDNKLNLRTISGTSNVTVTQAGNYLLISGTTVDGGKIEKTITQATHGFVVGDVLAYSGSSYYKPVSNITSGEPLGVVSTVNDTDTFVIVYQGYLSDVSGMVDENSNPLLAQTVYYLSPTNAGKLTTGVTTTEDDVVKPMIVTLTATDANVVNYRGDIVLAAPDQYFTSNVGSGTGEVYSGTTGTTTLLRTITGRDYNTVTTSGDTIVIDVFGNENVGGGAGLIYSGTTGTSQLFRSISSGNASTVSTSDDTIVIDVDTGSTKTMAVLEYVGQSYTATTANEFIGFSGNTTTPYSVYLPASPIIGKPVIVADIRGDANTDNITIEGNGNNVDGASSAVINTNYGAMQLLYTGTIWKVISFA